MHYLFTTQEVLSHQEVMLLIDIHQAFLTMLAPILGVEIPWVAGLSWGWGGRDNREREKGDKENGLLRMLQSLYPWKFSRLDGIFNSFPTLLLYTNQRPQDQEEAVQPGTMNHRIALWGERVEITDPFLSKCNQRPS